MPVKPIAAATFSALLLSAILSGCSSAPKAKPTASIENRTGRSLKSVVYRPCGKNDSKWLPLLESSLASQNRVTMELPLECLDLRAEFSDGKIAGSQHSIQRRFPFTWILE